MIIRNDDVAVDTTLWDLQGFCDICDQHQVRIIQAITPLGACRPIRFEMGNNEIRRVVGAERFDQNQMVLQYLQGRQDLIAVHGLYHTHVPTEEAVQAAQEILTGLGLPAQYFAPPFNEGIYPAEVCGLQLLQHVPRLEDYLMSGNPDAEIVYLHSWRFQLGPFTWKQLDQCLKRLNEG